MQSNNIVQLGKWGNTIGITIPQFALEALSLRIEDKMDCGIENGKIILSPIKRKKYKLDDLLAEVEELSEEISWGKIEGGEVW